MALNELHPLLHGVECAVTAFRARLRRKNREIVAVPRTVESARRALDCLGPLRAPHRRQA